MKILFASIAVALLVVSPGVRGEDPLDDGSELQWTQITEGVFEATDSCGTRHVHMKGEQGVLWSISEYEAKLAALRDQSGEIPNERRLQSESLEIRLRGLYELVGKEQEDGFLAPGCLHTADIRQGTGDCDEDDYSYYVYACGKWGEFNLFSPYGYATGSLTNCSGGWSGRAEAYTYRASGGEETNYVDSEWSQSPTASSTLTFSSGGTCGYAWARLTVCYNCENGDQESGEARSYDVWEAEDDYPDACY